MYLSGPYSSLQTWLKSRADLSHCPPHKAALLSIGADRGRCASHIPAFRGLPFPERCEFSNPYRSRRMGGGGEGGYYFEKPPFLLCLWVYTRQKGASDSPSVIPHRKFLMLAGERGSLSPSSSERLSIHSANSELNSQSLLRAEGGRACRKGKGS